MITKAFLVGAIALGSFSPTLSADEDSTIPDILDEYTKALEAWVNKSQDASPEKQFALRSERPDPAEYAKKLWFEIDNDPTTEAACTGLIWILSNDRANKESLKSALTTLTEAHTDDPKMVGVCETVGRMRMAELIPGLQSIIENTSEDSILGHALMGKASIMMALNDSNPDEPEFDPSEIEAVLERIVNEFGDVEAQQGTSTLAKTASPILFSVKNLAIGKVSPDITGDDTDGVAFKLSDYRGKVVLLDFWGHW